MTEPEWAARLRERRDLRLVRAWGLAGPRALPELHVAGWRDDGSFVTVQPVGFPRPPFALRHLELDPRTGAFATRMLEHATRSPLLLPGARSVLVREGAEVLEVELSSGRPLRGFAREAALGEPLALSPDGERAVFAFAGRGSTAYGGGMDRLGVRPLGGGEVRWLFGATAPVTFSRDGRHVLAARKDAGTLACYDARSGRRVTTAHHDGSRAVSIEAAANGVAHVLVPDRGLFRWDFARGAFEAMLKVPEDGAWLRVARVSGEAAVEVLGDGRVRWCEGGRVVEEWRLGGALGAAWVSPDLGAAAVVRGAELVAVVRGRGPVTVAEDAPAWHSQSLAMSHDGRRLAAGGDRGAIEVRDVDDGAVVWSLEGHRRNAESACFHPSGRALFSLDGDGALLRWDLDAGMEAARLATGFRLGVGGRLRCSPDGAWLAFEGFEGIVMVRAEGELAIAYVGAHEAWSVGLGFDEHGALVAVERDGPSSGGLLWRLRGGVREPLGELPALTNVAGAVFGSDGGAFLDLDAYLNAAGEGYGGSRRMLVVDVESRATRAEVPIEPAAFDLPHLGTRRVTVAADRGPLGAELTRFDAFTGERVARLHLDPAHGPPVALAVSADDRRVAVALATGAVLLFEEP